MPNTVEAKVAQSNGPAFVERNGNKIALNEGDAIYESDLIITGSDTTLDLAFRDGTKSRIGPDSEMRLVDFEFGPGEEASFVVNLTQGAMRTVTGEIVKLNPEAFEVVTPRATAGIRGTEFITEVRGDTENHVVLYISGGSVMVLDSVNGTTLSFDKPLMGSTVGADGSLSAKSYSIQEMTAMLSQISPAMGANIPTKAEDQGKWSDINTDMHANSSDVMAGLNVSIVYDDAQTLESLLTALQKTAGIIINSVVAAPAEAALLQTENLEEMSFATEMLQEELIASTNVFSESVNSSSSSSIANNHSNLGSHSSGSTGSGSGGLTGGNIPADLGTTGQSYSDNNLTASVSGTNNNDSFTYYNVSGHTINAGNGNDSVNITNLSGGYVYLENGNDIVNVTNFTGGTIDGGSGFDFIVYNGDLSGKNVTNVEAQITGSGASSISSLTDLQNLGVVVNTNNTITCDNNWSYDSASNAYTNATQNITITLL